MRLLSLICLAFPLYGVPAFAQNAAPVPAPPNSQRLDELLKSWEKRMSGLESFSSNVTRVEVHPLTRKQTKFVGDFAFMKPNLFRINLTHEDEVNKNDAEKTSFERIYCDGKYVYEFSPKDKQIIRHDMPKADPADDNLLLTFLRGMKVADVQKRFNVTLYKEDDWYAYLRFTSKTDADKQEFTTADLAIWIKNQKGQPDLIMIPNQFRYTQPNGKVVVYTLGGTQPNPRLAKESFTPRKPADYKQVGAGANRE